MKHICYIGKRTDDLANLESGRKTMIIRGTKNKSAPYECVFPGDIVYFSNGKDDTVLSAVVEAVKNIKNPKRLELMDMLEKNEEALMLGSKRMKKLGKHKYFVIVQLGPVSRVKSPKMDDIIYEDKGFWLIAGDSLDKKAKSKGIGITLRIR